MAQIQEQQQQVNISVNDLIFAQIKDLGKRMDRFEKALDVTRNDLNARMDRLEHRQDRLEEKFEITRRELNARMDKQDEKIEKLDHKIDETRKELSNKIDDLHKEIKSSTGHISIANISTVGIALAVIYSILK